MRRLLLVPALLALAACEKPNVINLGQTAEGKPRFQIPLDAQTRREIQAERTAAARPAGNPLQEGMPLPTEPARSVYEGPVTVGLRRDGACVVVGKALCDDEIGARLAFVRAERVKAGSEDVTAVTVLTEDRVPMDRVFRAMSCGRQAGFSKIGWQLAESIPLPEPEGVSAAQPADESRLIVSVRADGSLRLGREDLEAKDLEGRLRAAVSSRAEQSLPPPDLTVLAYKDAPLPAVQQILEACKTAGIASVDFGTPVPVAVAGAPGAPAGGDYGEAYRNWRLGLEDREVDFSEGAPAYWYYALYHAWMDESSFLQEATEARNLNRARVRHFGDKAALRLEQMAHLLDAVEPPRAEILKGSAGELRRKAAEAAEDRLNLELLRFHLKSIRSKVSQSFGPSTVTFPEGVKIPPPEKKEAKEEGKP